MGQLKWVWSQTMKMTQIKDSKSLQSNNKKIDKKEGPIFQSR